MRIEEIRGRLPAWMTGALAWKSAAVVAVSAAVTLSLVLTVSTYTTRPVFLLLTVGAIFATLVGGWVAGLLSLSMMLLAFRYFMGGITSPVRERLLANVLVDFLFIVLITYLRHLANGRERARVAAVARSRDLEQTANALREALGAAEERRAILETIMEHIPLGITISDAGHASTRAVSRYGRELLGDASGACAATWPMLHADGVTSAHPEEVPLSRALRGEVVSAEEWVVVRADGEKVPILCTAAPIRDREGAVKGGVAGWQDLTQRKLAEKALIHSEKLAATGRLAATIAHEINNPLAAITNIVYLLDQLTTDPAAREYLELINSELRSVTRIATQTLKFHREHGKPILFSLKEMLSELLEFYGPKAMKHGVSIAGRWEAEATIIGFAGETRQVMSNLLLNAIEATPAGGKVVVHCYQSKAWRGVARGYRVTIADNGVGIDPQSRAHIFEPFFTTKGEKGTGLGLWVSAGIVNRAGGSIRVRSTPRAGRSGTCFSVFLPADVPAGARLLEVSA